MHICGTRGDELKRALPVHFSEGSVEGPAMDRLALQPWASSLAVFLLLVGHCVHMASINSPASYVRSSKGHKSDESIIVSEAGSAGRVSAKVSDADLARILAQKAASSDKFRALYGNGPSADGKMTEALKHSIDQQIEMNEAETDGNLTQIAKNLKQTIANEEAAVSSGGKKGPMDKVVEDLAEAEVSNLEATAGPKRPMTMAEREYKRHKAEYSKKMSMMLMAMLEKEENKPQQHPNDKTILNKQKEVQQVMNDIDEAVGQVVPENAKDSLDKDKALAKRLQAMIDAEKAGNKKEVHRVAEDVLGEVQESVPAMAEAEKPAASDLTTNGSVEITDTELAKELDAAMHVKAVGLKKIQESDVANDNNLTAGIIRYLKDNEEVIKRKDNKIERKEQDVIDDIAKAGIKELEEKKDSSVTDLERARLVESVMNRAQNIEEVVKSPKFETPQEEAEDIARALIQAGKDQLDPDEAMKLQDGPLRIPKEKLVSIISLMLWKSQLPESDIDEDAEHAYDMLEDSLAKLFQRDKEEREKLQKHEHKDAPKTKDEELMTTTPLPHKLTQQEIDAIFEDIMNKTRIVEAKLKKKHDEEEAKKKLTLSKRGPMFVKSMSPSEIARLNASKSESNKADESTVDKAHIAQAKESMADKAQLAAAEEKVVDKEHLDKEFKEAEKKVKAEEATGQPLDSGAKVPDSKAEEVLEATEQKVAHVNITDDNRDGVALAAAKAQQAVEQAIQAMEATQYGGPGGAPGRPWEGGRRLDYDYYGRGGGYGGYGGQVPPGGPGGPPGAPYGGPYGRPGYWNRAWDSGYERRRAQDAIMGYLRYVRSNLRGKYGTYDGYFSIMVYAHFYVFVWFWFVCCDKAQVVLLSIFYTKHTVFYMYFVIYSIARIWVLEINVTYVSIFTAR